jgi:hypothetical protein
MKKLPSINELSLELFNSVQSNQGYAHISRWFGCNLDLTIGL